MTSFINQGGNVHKYPFHLSTFETIKDENSKLCTYGKTKERIGYADYLNDLVNIKDRIAMTKLRLANHNLMIETGRKTGSHAHTFGRGRNRDTFLI